MTLLAENKYQQFSQSIPLRVDDFMTPNVFTLYEDDDLNTLFDVMDWRSIRHVPVVNVRNELIGLISQRDCLRVSISSLSGISEKEKKRLYRSIKVGSIMGRTVQTVSTDTPLTEAAALMVKNKYGCLPVVKNRILVGILTETDFVKSYLMS